MFSRKKKIYFDQIDAGGIIYFAELFKLFHQVYEEFLNSLNTKENYFKSRDFILPIIHSEADYIKPVKLHDDLEISVSVTQLRESSFELSYFGKCSGNLMAKGKTVHVLVNRNNFEKVKLHKDLINGLKKYMAD